MAETAAFLPLLVARFVVELRAPTFLLFFTELPSSFENLSAPSRHKIQVMHFLSLLGLLHYGRPILPASTFGASAIFTLQRYREFIAVFGKTKDAFRLLTGKSSVACRENPVQ
jgi:hypothetical protein